MNGVEANTQSFILKIWAEETADDGRWISWRGHITHVPSKERRYIQSLSQISTVIASYIEPMEAHRPTVSRDGMKDE